MLFSTNLFAALLAVAAVGVTGSPVEVEKRGLGTVSYCEGEQFAQPCRSQPVDAGQCYNIIDGFKQKVKSIEPLGGTFNCNLFP
jgi:hypothetical protein